jgi:repressor LexA
MDLMLTEKQIRVLRYYRDYKRENGIAPTLEEAAEALGVSKITIYEHLSHLQRKGAIHRDKAKARAVSILFDPDRNRESQEAEKALPLLGMIAAGRPIEALEDREDIRLDDLVPTGDGFYLLRVKGKSMIEDHIDDGDLVVIERRETARDGEIVVAILNGGDATLKRFYRDNGRVRLQPANANMAPIYPNECEIRGVVRGVVRRFR